MLFLAVFSVSNLGVSKRETLGWLFTPEFPVAKIQIRLKTVGPFLLSCSLFVDLITAQSENVTVLVRSVALKP